MYKALTERRGKKVIIREIVHAETGECITPLFDNYTCPEDYINSQVIGVEPMTAKEYLNDRELEEMLTSTDYIAEEKLDGTRSTLHLNKGYNRLFSRRISKKTNWYAENTDSLPHLRDFVIPLDYHGTILDGEMRIDGREFKDVSSTLNCKWDEAIMRQSELGYITFHAFDIVYYKGVYIAKMPLMKRKEFLEKVIKELNNPYIKLEYYTDDNAVVKITDEIIHMHKFGNLSAYPNLKHAIDINVTGFISEPFDLEVDKRTWYEYIIATGGEGLMLKPKNGIYRHARGREYTKLKKFDTWDVVILDYVEPTEEYTGKELDTWQYWGVYRCGQLEKIVIGDEPDRPSRDHTVEAVTKHFAKDWIGTVKFGVIITPEELEDWKKINPDKKPEIVQRPGELNQELLNYLVVGECSGFDEPIRIELTENRVKYLGTVIEIGANELLKTGKLRHPRFMRFREDKEAERCTWKDHVRK